MYRPFLPVLLTLCAAAMATAATDADRDGLSDETEQTLLDRFAPRFLISSGDCAKVPAEFIANAADPRVREENGAIYGQVSPHGAMVEIRYFHLWSRDCGRMSHALDVEHVSVLVTQEDGQWKALRWYAGAHEETVCDNSRIIPAADLRAEREGATIWISAGKHASFLTEELCRSGCGSDRCTDPVRLKIRRIINLGEAGAPMNGAVWASSPRWGMSAKMRRSDFPDDAEMLLSAREHPQARAVIAAGSTTLDAVATGNAHTEAAIETSEDQTNQALSLSFRKVKNALGRSKRAVRDAIVAR